MEVEWTLGYALSEVHFLDEQPIGEVEELIEDEADVEFMYALESNGLTQVIDDHIVEVVEEMIDSMNEPIEASTNNEQYSEDNNAVANELVDRINEATEAHTNDEHYSDADNEVAEDMIDSMNEPIEASTNDEHYSDADNEVAEGMIDGINEAIEAHTNEALNSDDENVVAHGNESREQEQDEVVSGQDYEVGDSHHDDNDQGAVDYKHQEFQSEETATESESEREPLYIHSEDTSEGSVNELRQDSWSNPSTGDVEDLAEDDQEIFVGIDFRSIFADAESRSVISFARQMRQILLFPLLGIVNVVRRILFSIFRIRIR